MATIKSYTDIEQSRKLAKILPIKSADMWWSRCTIIDFGYNKLKVSYSVEPCNISQFRNTKEDIPCWSLAALLDVLRRTDLSTPDTLNEIRYSCWNDYDITYADNPIDACVAMIEKLHELNLL